MSSKVNVLAVVAWSLFFASSLLALADRIELTFGKGMIILAFFLIGFFSSVMGASRYGQKPKG